MLKESPWFDIPIGYINGSRAILATEKGLPGYRAFAKAFAVWGEKVRLYDATCGPAVYSLQPRPLASTERSSAAPAVW